MPRVAVVGTVSFTSTCIRALSSANLPPVGVLGRKSSPLNTDYEDVVAVARGLGLRAEYVHKLATAEEIAILNELRPDVLLVLGWSFLLPTSARSTARLCVGAHPSPLPIGRGRHPIVWAIALGLTATALSLFELTDVPDAGPILWQRSLPIGERDDAAAVYAGISRLASDGVPELVRQVASGTLAPRPQDESRAVVWRRRSNEDGRIDWRMSSVAIDRLIRALARPYVGAHIAHTDGPRAIWRSEIPPRDPRWTAIEPGRVLQVDGTRIRVRTGDGAIDLVDHELSKVPAVGAYL